MSFKKSFITYAHRGASHYCPENTLMSFYMGIQMGANGIETDVKKTKDGVLVLFHDDTLERACGGAYGRVSDYTYRELLKFNVAKDGITDKIPTLDDFLSHFGHRNITFAIEIKDDGIEKEVVDAIYKYEIQDKTVVTSFELDHIKNVKAYQPALRVGYLTRDTDDTVVKALKNIGAEEICPLGSRVTAQRVSELHELGFNVRAWGITNERLMKNVYDCGVDGMTTNFPDLLLAYIKEKSQEKS